MVLAGVLLMFVIAPAAVLLAVRGDREGALYELLYWLGVSIYVVGWVLAGGGLVAGRRLLGSAIISAVYFSVMALMSGPVVVSWLPSDVEGIPLVFYLRNPGELGVAWVLGLLWQPFFAVPMWTVALALGASDNRRSLA